VSRTRPLLALAIATLVAGVPGVALAQWSTSSVGTASARADVMPGVAAPTVSVSGRDVTVSWSPSVFTSGQAVAGYTVRRYDAISGTPQTILASCDGTVTTTTCVEANVPAGQWTYTLTPKHGPWTGLEGSPSATVSIAAPNLTLAPTSITSLPAVLTGGIGGFATGESVTFRLDNPITGPALAGSITPNPVPDGGAASVSVTLPGGTSIGSHTVYAVGSLGTVAAAAVSVSDGTAPTVSAAVMGKTEGGTPGFVRGNGTYYVYANVTDPGDPATSVASVTADVSALTTGQTSLPMVAGSWTVGGVAYNYRSGSLPVSVTPPVEGSRTFSVRAQDVASNVTTQGGFTVTVDNTRPTGLDVQTANASGGTVGRAETGDTLTLTFSEPMEPGSFLAGWSGATTVTVRLVQAGGGDRFQIWNQANTTQLPFGTVNLGRTDYVTATRTFTGSTMVMSGSTIVVTLGTPSGAVTTAAGNGSITWTPSTTPYDRAGNVCRSTAASESGPADREF
jgi:hypothetical protein